MLAQQKGIAMKLSKQQIVLPALLFMIACAYGQDVHYNYDRGANFQSYRTYQWIDLQKRPGGPSKADLPAGLPDLPIGPPPMSGSNVQDDQLLDQDIKRAVDGQLAEKGLTKVDKGGDLLVGYQANVREEKSIDLWGTGGGGLVGRRPLLGGRLQLASGPDFYHSRWDAGGGPL